jgi:hypothetical protein
VRVTAGAKHLGMFQKIPASQRQYCTKCGGHVMTNHPLLGLVDVFASTLPTLKFKPALHINYAEGFLKMKSNESDLTPQQQAMIDVWEKHMRARSSSITALTWPSQL